MDTILYIQDNKVLSFISNIPYLTKFNNFCQQIHLNTDHRQQDRFPDFKNGTRTPSAS